MKNLLKVAVVAIVMLAGATVPAQAQFRFGLKAGLNVDRLSLNSDIFNSDNRAGFTGGAMIEFTVPVVNLGFDLSAMYVRRNSKFMESLADGTSDVVNNNRDYIEIPLNFKYKLGLPGIGKFISPFITTGPSVAFLTSKKHIVEAYKNKTVDAAWNFGLGVELINHVQIHASYGLGITKAMQALHVTGDGAGIQGKNRYWTVTAAYLF